MVEDVLIKNPDFSRPGRKCRVGAGFVSAAASLAIEGLGSPRWYVARTQPHREFRAEKQLAAQGFPTFLPVYWKTTRHARRFRTAKAPFFPGYLFVELTVGRDRWRNVNGTFGVSQLIMAGDLPKPVPTGVVETLMAASDPGGMMSFGDDPRPVRVGRILSGPFAGCVGELIKLTPAGRVQVLLEIMGSHVSVSVRKEALAPVA